MIRYRFAVEYLGTDYAGWQIQPGQPTIERELEDAFSVVLHGPINILGSGRTDAGVHARGQVAHFDCVDSLTPFKVERSVNALTSKNIFIRRLEPCHSSFHSRHDALARYYRYYIALKPTALFHNTSWGCRYSLDEDLFRKELTHVRGHHNFANFCVDRKDGKPSDCIVNRSEVERSGSFLIVHLQANRFLHKMVRAIVGACFDVARGYHPPGLVAEIFSNRFSGEWTWAPSHGLCLEKVIYSDYDY